MSFLFGPPGFWPAAPVAVAVSLCQALLLLFPAWRLAGRNLLVLPLWIPIVLYAGALPCWLLNRYDWPTAAGLPALVALVFLVRDRFVAPAAPADDTPGAGRALAGGLTPFPPGARTLLAAWFALVLLGLFLNLRAPPANWDALTYHIDFPLQWLQAGRFVWGRTDFGDLSPPYYPALPQLYFGWWLLPGSLLSGGGLQSGGELLSLSDAAGAFWLVLIWLTLREILYDFADDRTDRTRTGEPRTALLCELVALFVALTPYFLESLLGAESDTMLAAFFALTYLFARRARRAGFAPRTTLYLGLAAGGLVATKYSGLVYLIALAPLLIGPVHTNQGRTGAATLFALVAFLIAGGWWYARNLLWTGNPFYPGEVRLPGTDWILFAGYYTTDFFAAHPFHRYSLREFLTEPAFAPLFWSTLAALGAALVKSVRRGRGLRGAAVKLTRPGLVSLLVLVLFFTLIPLRLPRLLAPLATAIAPLLMLALAQAEPPAAGWRRSLVFGSVGGATAILALLFLFRLAELFHDPLRIELSLTGFTRASVHYGLAHSLDVALFAVLFGVCFAIGRTRLRLALVISFLLCISAFATRADVSAFVPRAGDEGRAWHFWWRTQTDRTRPWKLGVIGTNALTPLRGPNGDWPVTLLIAESADRGPLHERSYARQTGAVPRRPRPTQAEFERMIERKRIDAVLVRTQRGVDPPRWHPEREFLREEPPPEPGRPAGWRRIFAAPDLEIYARPDS